MLDDRKPEIVVFAGPNGSGKSTITRMATKTAGIYINADDIKASTHCDDLDAAKKAEALREECLSKAESFTFETVLSTERNMLLLRRARDRGYFIRGIYIFTRNPNINISRVEARVSNGGHGVPDGKIIDRYYRSIALLPEFVEVCDICHVYDNSMEVPYRVFKKRKTKTYTWPSEFWTEERIACLVSDGHI